jgi:anti-sigma B factor antagonist
MASPADPSEGVAAVGPPFSANLGRRSPTTVFIHGEVDVTTAPTMAEQVRNVIDQNPKRLTLDLADMSFMDCSGVSVIAYAVRESPGRFEVVLRHPRRLTRTVLELTGMNGPCLIEP